MNNAPVTVPSPEQPSNPLVRIFTSSKAIVVLFVVVGCFAAIFAGAAKWQEVVEFMKWVLGFWLGAVGIEDASGKIANAMKKP